MHSCDPPLNTDGGGLEDLPDGLQERGLEQIVDGPIESSLALLRAVHHPGSSSSAAAVHSGAGRPAQWESTISLANRSAVRRSGAVTWAYAAAIASARGRPAVPPERQVAGAAQHPGRFVMNDTARG